MKVGFNKGKTKDDALISSASDGVVYIATDEDSIVIGGREVANKVLDKEEAEIVTNELLPEVLYDFTAFDLYSEIETDLEGYVTLGNFARSTDKSIKAGSDATITLHDVEGGSIINILTNTTGWGTSDTLYKVSEINKKNGLHQIKYENRVDGISDVVFNVKKGCLVYSISIYTNSDSVHERIDSLIGRLDDAGVKKEVKCSLSEYYALRKAGSVDPDTRYYIINIDCDFEATEL